MSYKYSFHFVPLGCHTIKYEIIFISFPHRWRKCGETSPSFSPKSFAQCVRVGENLIMSIYSYISVPRVRKYIRSGLL